MHSACVCNEIVSAVNRVLGVVPLPTRAGIAELRREARKMAAPYGHLDMWTNEQVLESFTGARHRRYEEAYNSLLVSPLCSSDARIQSFVKAEKFDPMAKINPDPRMIQARSPRYNFVLCKYLRPVEHIIYNLCDRHGVRAVAKGMNQRQRAATLVHKFSMFNNPVCFSIDCSRWDKHVSPEVLGVEHAFYKMLLPQHPEFDRLLSWQARNRCRTKGGVKYEVEGGRMSGDINTALGNCLLMVIMARAAMRSMRIKHYQLLDDGDDCLVLVEEEDFVTVSEQLQQKFLEYGQELKIENVAREIYDVIFCQSKIVFDGHDYLFVRDWRKVLSHACCGTKHWNEPPLVRPMMGLVGSCELALCKGIPILQAFAEALIRNSMGKIASMLNLETGLAYRVKAEYGADVDIKKEATSVEITDEARNSFEKSFGVPDWEQRAIEEILSRWTISSVETTTVPIEWDHRWTDDRSLLVHIPQIY